MKYNYIYQWGWRTIVFPARLDVIPLAYIATKNTPIILRYAPQINLQISHKSAHKSTTKSGSGLLIQTVRPSSWTVPDNPSKTSDRPVKIIGLNDLNRPDQ